MKLSQKSIAVSLLIVLCALGANAQPATKLITSHTVGGCGITLNVSTPLIVATCWSEICDLYNGLNLTYFLFALIALGAATYLIWKRRGKRRNKQAKPEKPNKHTQSQLAAQRYALSEEDIRQVRNLLQMMSDMKPTLDWLKRKFGEEQNEIAKLKKEIDAKAKQIDELNRDKASLNQTMSGLRDENSELKQRIEKLNKLDADTTIVPDSKEFVDYSSQLLAKCQQAEELIHKYVISLNASDLNKMAYFMSRYIQGIPIAQRDKWTSVLSTLSVKGYVKGQDIVPHLKSCATSKNQIEFLRKHSVEDLWRPYLSTLLIMLDEMHCATTFGLSQDCKEAAVNIENITAAAKSLGLNIDNVRLFCEPNKEVEADIEDLPQEVKSIVPDKNGVINFIFQIAINGVGINEEKTKYYMPL